MKKTALTAILLAAAMGLSACGASGAASMNAADNMSSTEKTDSMTAGTVTKITAAQAYARMQSGDPVTIVDVRTADEYAAKHIPGAVLVPNEEIGDTAPAELPDKNAEILVYCRSGHRSALAAKKLADMGYTKIYDFGGINDWTYETETGAWDPKNAVKNAVKDTAKDAASAAMSAASAAVAADSTAYTVPAFTTTGLDGRTYDQSIFAGHKLTMVNVWATYCGPCVNELPELAQLSAELKDQDIQIIGVVSDVMQSDDGSFDPDGIEAAKELVSQTGADDYTHILPSSELISAMLQGVYAVPTTIFFNEKGQQVGTAYIGSNSAAKWTRIISTVLAEVKG